MFISSKLFKIWQQLQNFAIPPLTFQQLFCSISSGCHRRNWERLYKQWFSGKAGILDKQVSLGTMWNTFSHFFYNWRQFLTIPLTECRLHVSMSRSVRKRLSFWSSILFHRTFNSHWARSWESRIVFLVWEHSLPCLKWPNKAEPR